MPYVDKLPIVVWYNILSLIKWIPRLLSAHKAERVQIYFYELLICIEIISLKYM